MKQKVRSNYFPKFLAHIQSEKMYVVQVNLSGKSQMGVYIVIQGSVTTLVSTVHGLLRRKPERLTVDT